MKRLALLIMFLILTSCGSKMIYLDSATIEKVVTDKEFTYTATRAFPTNYDVINVINSIPGAASTRLMNLDPGYGFNLSKDLFSVYLPYFGRAFNATPGNADNSGFRFESKNFSVKNSKTKKGNDLVVITPKDQKANMVFNLEIFKNGGAYLSINSNDRQPISFDGNISADK